MSAILDTRVLSVAPAVQGALAQALPACDPMVAALSRRLYGRCMPWPSGGVLRWQAVDGPGAVLQVQVQCDGEVFELQWCDELPAAWPDELCHPALPARLRQDVLAALLEPLADGLSLGGPPRLLDAQVAMPAWGAGEALGWALLPGSAGQDAPLRGRLRALRPAGWARLAARVPMDLPLAWHRDAQRLGLSVHAAPIPVSRAELRGLVPGDVLLLDAGQGGRDRLPVRLCLGGRWLAGVRGLSLGHALLITQTQARDDAAWASPLPARTFPPMNAAASSPAAASAATSASVSAADALPVVVDVALSRLSLTLEQLRSLNIGQVFELETSPDAAQVVLSCGGQRLGLGQLMVVGERLGVRVVALATPATPAVAAEPAAGASA